MSNITIVGTGKLAFAVTLGFLRAINLGMLDAKLIIIGRSKESLEKFNSLRSAKIITTTKYEDAKDGDYCILCILPTGVQELYPKLKTVFEKFRTSRTVISLTSGLNIMEAKNLLGVFHGHMVCGTTTTNVAYGLGYSVFAGINGNNSALPSAVKLFNYLGKTSIVKGYKNVLKSIPIVGSGNAFDATFLWAFTQYEESRGNQASHCKRLRYIGKFLSRAFHSKNPLEYLLRAKTRARRSMVNYIIAKLRYLTGELGYEQDSALKLILETMQLTIEVLIKSYINKEAIENHNNKIVTKGGCTERGIGELRLELNKVFNLELAEPNFSLFESRYREIMRPVYKRTLLFKKDAKKI